MIHSIKVSIDSSLPAEAHVDSNPWLCPLKQFPDTPERPRKAITHDNLNFQTLSVHHNYSLDSRVSIGNFLVVESASLKSFWFHSLHQNSSSLKMPRTVFNFGLSRYSNWQVRFLSSRSQWTISNLSEFWTNRSVILFRASVSSLHQNFDSQKSPWKAINIDLSRFSNSNFSVTTTLTSSTNVSMEGFKLAKECSIENQGFRYLR